MAILARHSVDVIWAFGRNISCVHSSNIQLAIFRFFGVTFIAGVSLVVGMWLVAGPAAQSFVNAGGGVVVAASGLVADRRRVALHTKPVNGVVWNLYGVGFV